MDHHITAVSKDCSREMKLLLLTAFNTQCILCSSLNYSQTSVFFQLQTSGTTLHTSPRDFLDPWAATNYFCQPPDQLETLENG